MGEIGKMFRKKANDIKEHLGAFSTEEIKKAADQLAADQYDHFHWR